MTADNSDAPTGEYDGTSEELVRLMSQIQALMELLDVADNNVIEQSSRLERLNQQLEEARNVLQSQRSDMAAYLAHDINIELVGQRMLLEGLLKSSLDDSQSKIVDTLAKSNKKVMDVVRNLIKVDELMTARDNFKFQSSDIRAFCEKVLGRLYPLLVTSGVTVKTDYGDDLPEVSIDRAAFEQALSIILQNGIGNSSQGEEVLLSVYEKSKGVAVSVRDSGKIEQNYDVAGMFDSFWKGEGYVVVDDDDLPFRLFFVSQIVRAHKGSIEHDGSRERGNSITMTFPLPEN